MPNWKKNQIWYNISREAITLHVNNESTVALKTRYGGSDVTNFFNPGTHNRVLVNRTKGTNKLISFWKDDADQYASDLKLMAEQYPDLLNNSNHSEL